MADYVAHRESASSFKTRRMLLAYSPQAVHDALEDSLGCYVKVIQIFDQWRALKFKS